MKREKSFTLIELLVVMAIIGLLASIVMVSLKGAKERAQLAKTAQWARSVFGQLGADAVLVMNFNDCCPDGTCTDLSGYSNHGTLHITYPGGCTDGVPGFTGKALYFDGENDHMEVPDAQSLDLTTWTITFWAKVGKNKFYNTLILKGTEGFENISIFDRKWRGPLSYLLYRWFKRRSIH